MKKMLFFLVFALFLFGSSQANAADLVYEYAEKGNGGELTLQDTPDGYFLTIATGNERGHTCDLSGYECVRKGSQFDCFPHEGDDPDMIPLTIKIMKDKSIRVAAAKKGKSLDSNFCGTTATLSGKYVPKR